METLLPAPGLSWPAGLSGAAAIVLRDGTVVFVGNLRPIPVKRLSSSVVAQLAAAFAEARFGSLKGEYSGYALDVEPALLTHCAAGKCHTVTHTPIEIIASVVEDGPWAVGPRDPAWEDPGLKAFIKVGREFWRIVDVDEWIRASR